MPLVKHKLWLSNLVFHCSFQMIFCKTVITKCRVEEGEGGFNPTQCVHSCLRINSLQNLNLSTTLLRKDLRILQVCFEQNKEPQCILVSYRLELRLLPGTRFDLLNIKRYLIHSLFLFLYSLSLAVAVFTEHTNS